MSLEQEILEMIDDVCMIGHNLMFSLISNHILASFTALTDKELDFEVSGSSTLNTFFLFMLNVCRNRQLK